MNITLSTRQGPCPDFVMKSAKSVGKINIDKSLQKNRKQLANRLKDSSPLGACRLDYTFIVIAIENNRSCRLNEKLLHMIN